jgi:hypothetical protein
MADTELSRTDLLALLVPGAEGEISAQDLRDCMASLLGGYASIYVQDGSTAQTSIGATPAKLTGFAADGESLGLVPAHASDQITVPVAGTYLVHGDFCFSGTASRTFQLRLRKTAVEVAGIGCKVTLDGSGTLSGGSFSGLVACDEDDVLTVYVEADAESSSLTLTDAALVAKRVG